MGIVLVDVTMSLDGFIAGPDDAMDWVFDFFDVDLPDDVLDEARRTTGAALAGRHCYDVGRRATRSETSSLFGGGWSGPEFVLTHHPPEDEARASFTFLSGDIRDAVATAFAAADGKNLLVLGADVSRQAIDAGLVDEIRIHLAPILLGDGVRLFGEPGRPTIKLETISATPWGPITNLRYRVVK